MCSDAVDETLILRWRPLGAGIEHVAGRRLRSGYVPHSHDSYVVGLTTHGEQRSGDGLNNKPESDADAGAPHPVTAARSAR